MANIPYTCMLKKGGLNLTNSRPADREFVKFNPPPFLTHTRNVYWPSWLATFAEGCLITLDPIFAPSDSTKNDTHAVRIASLHVAFCRESFLGALKKRDFVDPLNSFF